MDYKVLLIFNLCFYKIRKTSKTTEPPGDARDAGSIPRSGRSLEKEMTTHSGILAWKIPWIEELGGV